MSYAGQGLVIWDPTAERYAILSRSFSKNRDLIQLVRTPGGAGA